MFASRLLEEVEGNPQGCREQTGIRSYYGAVFLQAGHLSGASRFVYPFYEFINWNHNIMNTGNWQGGKITAHLVSVLMDSDLIVSDGAANRKTKSLQEFVKFVPVTNSCS